MSIRTSSLIRLIALATVASACSASVPLTRSPVATTGGIECPGATLRTAADAAAYAGCDAINGDLRIAQSDLTGLSPLTRLLRVSGTLELANNPQLQELTGLERLTQVGALEISNNPALADLDGLGSLQSARFVTISNNARLRSLHGLEGLESAASVTIQHNGICHTTGLSSLRAVGSLVISNNPKLVSLAGLNGLRRAESVEITNNRMLSGYFGLLPRLAAVEHKLMLHSNAGLAQRDVRAVFERVARAAEQPALTAQVDANPLGTR
jgi:hypothetical protein